MKDCQVEYIHEVQQMSCTTFMYPDHVLSAISYIWTNMIKLVVVAGDYHTFGWKAKVQHNGVHSYAQRLVSSTSMISELFA